MLIIRGGAGRMRRHKCTPGVAELLNAALRMAFTRCDSELKLILFNRARNQIFNVKYSSHAYTSTYNNCIDIRTI